MSVVKTKSVIFIGGVCGSGKSTIGKLLATKLGFDFFDGDDFHSEENRLKMTSGIPLNDEDRKPWLKKLATLANEMFQMQPDLGKGRVITCSALKYKYRQILIKSIYLQKCCIIMLNVSKNVLIKRLESRIHFFNKNLLESQLKILELPKNNEETKEPYLLIVDGDLPDQKVIETIRNHLSI